MQKLLSLLIVGFAFTVINVEMAESQISWDHPCYDIEPGKRDGHVCWPVGEDPSIVISWNHPCYDIEPSKRAGHACWSDAKNSLGLQCDSEPTLKKISQCLKNLLLEHKPELKPFGCGKKKNNWDQAARGNCLRDLLDGAPQ